MYPVSQQYKEYLKEKFMPTWYRSRVVIGAVNQEAQSHSTIQNDGLTVYSNTDILEDVSTKERYACYERDHIRVDGSFSFLPDHEYKWTGITSEVISDGQGYIDLCLKITCSLDVPLSIKGITIVFPEDVHAVDFDILDKEKNIQLSYTGNQEKDFISTDVYILDKTIYLHIKKLNRPFYRYRQMSMKFGTALVFETEKIKSISYEETMQLISTGLYTLDISVAVDNTDRHYDIENPSSQINFLEQAQQMETYLSIKLPSGKDEQIKLCTTYLSDWTAKSDQAVFKGTDRFNFLNGTYDKDVYHPQPVSLYDKAVEVLKDAGLQDDEFLLDIYLKSVRTRNPLPAVTHKECLQLIANAGRCVLKQDREGRISILSSFIPDMSVQSDDQMVYSNLKHLLEDTRKEVYAGFEQDFITMDGKMRFLPYASFEDAGYVSKSLSDNACMYSSKPHLLLDFEAPANLFTINISFGQEISSDFIVSTYLDEAAVETIAFTGNTQKEFMYAYMFKKCNRVLITFVRSQKPLQRCYVNKINFDLVTDKHLYLDDISNGTLEGTKLETVRQLDMVKTVYTPAGEVTTDEVKVTKSAGDDPETVISFSDPLYDAHLLNGSEDITRNSSAWNVTARLSVPESGSIEHVLQLAGRKLNLTKQTIIFALNPTGAVKSVENPLIDDSILALDAGSWVAEYLKSDREYTFDYIHGDASLESGDIIHQDTRTAEIQSQICEHSLSISGSMNGTLKTRKVVK